MVVVRGIPLALPLVRVGEPGFLRAAGPRDFAGRAGKSVGRMRHRAFATTGIDRGSCTRIQEVAGWATARGSIARKAPHTRPVPDADTPSAASGFATQRATT